MWEVRLGGGPTCRVERGDGGKYKMAAMEFDDKGSPELRKNLQALGVGNDFSTERRVQILTQKLAELLAALQKAGIRTE